MERVLPTAERLTAAARLMEAIAACDPRDRAVLLSVALETLAAGEPWAPFLGIQQEAQDWASLATPQELEAYLFACVRQLSAMAMTARAKSRIAASLKDLI